MSWACLLKRVFDIGIERCPRCGGHLKIIAAIVDPQVIVQILAHLGLPARSATLTGAPLAPVPSGLTQSGFSASAGGPARPELAQAPRCASRSASLADESPSQPRKTGSFPAPTHAIDHPQAPR